MKTYYAVSFRTPPALEGTNIAGVIVNTITASATPSRQAEQRKAENHGFRGHVRIVRADRLESKYIIENCYIYERSN